MMKKRSPRVYCQLYNRKMRKSRRIRLNDSEMASGDVKIDNESLRISE